MSRIWYKPMWDTEPCDMDASLEWLTQFPREEIPWYPTLDPEACMGNRDCIAFCPGEVFRWDVEAGHAVVAAPFNCVIGCRECEQVCLGRAIRFPSPEAWLGIQEALRVKISEKVREYRAVTQ